MKNVKICLLIISLTFIGDLFPAAAAAGAGAGASNALKSFEESHDSSYIPQGEAGFKKILDLIHSPEYKNKKANGQVRNARGQTILYIAIFALRIDIVQLLLDNGESIYSVDNTPSDALEVANNVKDRIEMNIQANELDRTEYGEEAIVKGGIDLKKNLGILLKELNAINKIIVLIKQRQDIHSRARVLLTRMDQDIPGELTGIPKAVRALILEYLQA